MSVLGINSNEYISSFPAVNDGLWGVWASGAISSNNGLALGKFI